MSYDVLYKTLVCAKLLRIMFHKVDAFIRDYAATKYLVLFCLEKYNAIYVRIRYLIVLHGILMLKFGKTKVAKEEFYGAKKPRNIWDVNVAGIVVSSYLKFH